MSQAKRAGSGTGGSRSRSASSKISSSMLKDGGPSPASRGGRLRAAWTLRCLGGLFFIPAFVRLAFGDLVATVGSLGVAALMFLAAELIKRGTANEMAYNKRGIAKAPPPLKALGAGAVAAAAFLASYFMTDDGFAIAVLFAVLGGGAAIYAYGLDPTRHKLLEDDSEAGVSNERVIETVRLAEQKLADITEASHRLRSRDVRQTIDRIVAQAQRVLHQIEKDPGDIARARRFLVTYLDGTRDVVTKYAAQQQDLADTELADNLRRVLGTIEQVFIEQEEVLKKDEALDLEVKIEVLETQLKREGVN